MAWTGFSCGCVSFNFFCRSRAGVSAVVAAGKQRWGVRMPREILVYAEPEKGMREQGKKGLQDIRPKGIGLGSRAGRHAHGLQRGTNYADQ